MSRFTHLTGKWNVGAVGVPISSAWHTCQLRVCCVASAEPTPRGQGKSGNETLALSLSHTQTAPSVFSRLLIPSTHWSTFLSFPAHYAHAFGSRPLFGVTIEGPCSLSTLLAPCFQQGFGTGDPKNRAIAIDSSTYYT